MVYGGGKPMIRVGFILNFQDQGWIGGINYYHSLIDAVMSMPDRKIKPVIITGIRSDLPFIKDYPDIEIIRTKIFDRPLSFARIGIRKLLSYDPILEQLLKKHCIDILSHSEYVFHDASIPTVGWIPDFQHKHLPCFFSDREVRSRDIAFERICCLCSCIIFSSSNAKEDAEEYYPKYKSRYEVLHFVSVPMSPENLSDMSILKGKYPISEPYFLIPNQFWAHKNHRVVLEALKILHSQKKRVRVICTGNTHDYRNPEYYNSLIEFATLSGVSDDFIVLGIVPYPDLIGLMMHSVSLINPSFFEGWSTTVEEAKSWGLPIILSDIPVHREQNPAGGIYFHPEDAESLAKIMWKLWTSDGICDRELKTISARRELNVRKLEFGKQYEEIILKTINSRSKKQ
jgi:glycosyltransferase involved in cell wall biosynthesis